MKLCKVCGHDKSLHHVHVGPDHTGKKVKHVGCMFEVKKEIIKDFLGDGIHMPICHTCSCHGVKPNTYLKRGIKKYQKYLKTLPKNEVSAMYQRKELKELIRDFKKDIAENPKNLLHWQMQSD